jgi:transmembrane sensor
MSGSGKSPELYQIEDFVTDESFISYFFHRNTDDVAFWEQWLISHPANRFAAQAAKDMLRNLTLTLTEEEYKTELSKITKAINQRIQPVSGTGPQIFRPLQWERPTVLITKKSKKYAKYLLPVLLVLIIGGTVLMRDYVLQSELSNEKYNDSEKPIVLTLSDGTVVTLAPHGRFRYPTNFGKKERRVVLDGEAQFSVSRDENQPFKVYAGDVIATVLGTVFNVKKLGGDSVVVIELISGKLKVETADGPGITGQSAILSPDERVLYRRKGKLLYKEKWQSQNDSQLSSNHLIFRRNNFEELAQQIKTVFGITIINQSNNKTWHFTGEFKNTSAINIIESICIVEKMNYVVQGDTVFIK